MLTRLNDRAYTTLATANARLMAKQTTHNANPNPTTRADNNIINTCSLKGLEAEDGAVLETSEKEMGHTEVYPQSIQHNIQGRFVAVCGDGEYIIYTAQRLRNKSFGSALDFVWSSTGKTDYATREVRTCRPSAPAASSRCSPRLTFARLLCHVCPLCEQSTSRVKVFKNFAEHRSFRPPFAAEGIFGGALLGVRSSDQVTFYDWDSGTVVRRIDECPQVT